MGKYGQEKSRSGILGSAFAPRNDICDIMLIKERVYLSFVLSCIRVVLQPFHNHCKHPKLFLECQNIIG